MSKIKFTAGRIAAHECEPGKKQCFLWDSDAPGLGLRATIAFPPGTKDKSRGKSYIFQAKLNGQAIRITIGDPKIWSINEAQAEARRLKVIIDSGEDPRQVKAEGLAEKQAVRDTKAAKAALLEAEARRAAVPLADAWDDYLKARKDKWGDVHYQSHLTLASLGGAPRKRAEAGTLTVAGPLASLMSLKLSELTSKKVLEWLELETKTRPTAAALSFRLLRAFAGWTNDSPAHQGIIPADTFNSRKVREAIPKSTTKEGDSLQREQLAIWFAEVRKMANPVISYYLQALLITGARREEMAGLRWEDVDFQWRSMTIRDKVEGTRTIPLTPYLAQLLHSLPRRNEWVFSSPAAADGKIAEPRHAHNQALEAAALPHVTLHGLRRSFGTLCEWVEVPSGISAQIMGHKPSALAEKHYRRRPLDLLRKWHDTIEAWILEQAGITFVPVQPGLRVVAAA